MRFFLATILLLSACSSSRPIDRTETQKEYEKEEAKNQERSMERSELITRVSALNSQIAAIASQIDNQNLVISNYSDQPEIASSQAMIDNAKVRIKHLNLEKAQLIQERDQVKAKLDSR